MIRKGSLRPRIRHLLPGRIRLSLPALKKIPEDRREDVEHHLAALALPRGIEDLQVSFITGSLLLTYSKVHCSEEEVLEWVEGLSRLAISIYTRLRRMEREQRRVVLGRLGALLGEWSINKIVIQENLGIPEHVWEKKKAPSGL